MQTQSSRTNMKIIKKSVCGACLSADRKLNDLLEFGDIFKIICKNVVKSINSETLLCFECFALLRNVKRFQEKVLKSQIILKNCTKDYFEKYLLNGLSNLSSTVANILEFSEPLNNEELHDDIKIEIDVNQDTVKLENEDHDTYDYNIFDYEPLEEETKISSPEIDIKEIPIETEIDTKKENIQDFEDKPKEEKKEEKCKNSKQNLQNDCQIPGETVIKKNKRREHIFSLNKPRSKLYKFIKARESYAYKRIKINFEEIKYWMDQERNSSSFKNSLYKCEKCALTIEQKKLEKHARRHSKHLKYICDYCTLSFAMKCHLLNHIENHRHLRCCATCGFKGIGKTTMRKHIHKAHDGRRKRLVQCLSCTTILRSATEFYKHYRNEHYQDNTKLICDHCNKKFLSRRTIEKHIFTHHTDYKCKICDMTFKTSIYFKYHNQLKHTIERSEASYCVKCDRQFDNVRQFKKHVSTSVAHIDERKVPPTKKTYPCLDPSCPKVFAKRYNMMRHYMLYHAKEFKFQCLKCNKSFLTNYKLKEHNKYHHEGYERERKHLCTICGRRFTTSEVLKNHIRTHTGERPYECPHCESRFAQRTAMVTHMRNIHKEKAHDKS